MNYGVCGDCTDDILSRLQTMPLPAHIKHILFLGGVNDIIQMRPQKFILEDLDKTLRYCQSKTLIWVLFAACNSGKQVKRIYFTAAGCNKRTFRRAGLAVGSAACCWTDCCRKEEGISGWRTSDGSRLQGYGNICRAAA